MDCQIYDNLKYGGYPVGSHCVYWEGSHQEMQSGERKGRIGEDSNKLGR